MGVFSENAIIGASAAGGYDIDQSLRFNDGDSAYLSRTAGTATSNDIGTLSFWAKRGEIGGGKSFFSNHSDANNRTYVGFDADTIQMYGKISGSGNVELVTTQVFRDPSAWYHIVIAVDVTQATSTNRVKIYVNGSQITAFSTATYPAQNTDLPLFSKTNHQVGAFFSSSVGDYYDGYLAEFHYIDGQALAPASFGETNSDTNQWVPVEYAGSYGTNGFYLKFGGETFLTYDREAEIAVTSSFTWAFTSSGNTSGEDLVNGLLTNNDAGGGWMPAGNAADRWIKFDFVTGKVYKACQWISINSTGSEGTWKWQGSNNDAAWTDIGGTFTLGGSDGGSNVTYNLGGTLNANTTSYRYYRILGISGTVNTSGRRLAMYFSETVYGLGGDSSGQGNNFSENNLSWSDQVLDTPTLNYCTMNPIDSNGSIASSEGNLKVTTTSTDPRMNATFQIPSTGKWYWEFLMQYSTSMMIGVIDQSRSGNAYEGNQSVLYSSGLGTKYNFSSVASYGATWTTGDLMGVAFNRDDNEITFYKNNSAQPTLTIGGTAAQRARLMPMIGTGTDGTGGGTFNFGQDSSFAGAKTAQGNGDDGEDFYYTPPTGYKALNTSNLDDPAIALPTAHFNSTLWTGDTSTYTDTRAITGVGHAPDLVWLKNSEYGSSNDLYDSVRGGNENLHSNSSDTETTNIDGGWIDSFDSDGFTLKIGGGGTSEWYDNLNGDQIVGWSWKAGGTASSNGDGSITSSVSANPTAGFSIVSYTSPGTSSDGTVGHGLSQAPELVIVKNRDSAYNWDVWNTALSSGYDLILNTDAAQTSGRWSTTIPTASLVSLKDTYEVNGTDKYIAYCFHSVEGYSKVGSYEGNANADGTFVYTGFQVAYLLTKSIDGSYNWYQTDNKSTPINVRDNVLYPDLSVAHGSSWPWVDFLSNGFKLRTSSSGVNNNTFIYLAFAESPFKYSNAR